MVTGCTQQQGVSSPEKQVLMGMPSRLHGFSLCWPVTMRASHVADNCILSDLGVVAYRISRQRLTFWLPATQNSTRENLRQGYKSAGGFIAVGADDLWSHRVM
jgi:hypothetical protein